MFVTDLHREQEEKLNEITMRFETIKVNLLVSGVIIDLWMYVLKAFTVKTVKRGHLMMMSFFAPFYLSTKCYVMYNNCI